MIRLTNLGALFTLIYLYKQETNMMIANESIWSKHIINIWQMLPKSVMLILLVLYVIILLENIILNSKKNIIIYLISLYILGVGTAIAINILNLQEITNLGLFNVYHPIPVENKVYFYKCELAHYQLLYKPEIYTSMEKLKYYKQILENNNLVDYSLLKNKSIEEITCLAKQVAGIKINYIEGFNIFTPLFIILILISYK